LKFFLLDKTYDVVLALGLLYHLKNPLGFLEAINMYSQHLLLSTRIVRNTPDGIFIGNRQMAYLVQSDECNNDATNFWMFTPEGLKLALKRTGWEPKKIKYLGCVDGSSNASDADKDERAFIYCTKRSKTELAV